MKLLSLNIGLPRSVEYRGKSFLTGIFKQPAEGRLRVSAIQIEGDGQADLSVHGGVDKAVYAYPVEHYPYWQAHLQVDELLPGAFGENLTTEGLLETDVHIGDRYRIGTVELTVTQPRTPCEKLGVLYKRPALVKEFWNSRRLGFYFSVACEGEIEAGDAIECVHRDERAVSIADVRDAYDQRARDAELLQRISILPDLPEEHRHKFAQRLEKLRS
ncbi:MAG: MOSC domain-containing protein [bacterium]|nr:MOSC domain-containing protein [bacterium]